MEDDPFLSHFVRQTSQNEIKMSQKTIDRIKTILKVLHQSKINKNSLESICFQGIPDECNGLRAFCWKLLLGYLPDYSAKWKSTLDTNRKNYENYLQDYFLPRYKMAKQQKAKKEASKTSESSNSKEEVKETEGSTTSQTDNTKKKKFILEFEKVDHPLSKEKNSTWNSYFKDQELWEDIEKDTRRTRSEMDFFQRPTQYPLKYINDVLIKDENESAESHSTVLSRILFIYGKLNPGVGYVQGMNEVVAPIYYCFCYDQNPLFVGHAEADTFFCFTHLMGDIQDGFVKRLDNTEVGIQARIKNLNELLKKIDKQLWAHLEKHNVNPQFYSLRWLMLLLTQEFEMSEVFRLWDCLISHSKRLDYVNYVCIAMIEGVRDKLIQDDEFATLMETLQKGTNSDLERILATAFRLYKQYAKTEDLIYHIVFPS